MDGRCLVDSKNSNGGGGQDGSKLDTVVLTYNRATDHLTIGGEFQSLDLALDILARATRKLEALYRIEQIKAVQQAAADQALAARIGLHGKG